jgi:hypothetical protein
MDPGDLIQFPNKNSSGLLGTLVTITGEEIPATSADRRVNFPHHELHHGLRMLPTEEIGNLEDDRIAIYKSSYPKNEIDLLSARHKCCK